VRCLAGAILLVQDILLVDAALNIPVGNPNKVLLPVALDLPPGAQLKLRDVFIMVTGEQLTDYIAFMLGVPQVGLMPQVVPAATATAAATQQELHGCAGCIC
jgi:hypothetical protein